MKKVAVLVVACLAVLVSIVPADAAVTLHCLTKLANGPIEGMGTAEHILLQREIFVRTHENRCSQTAGTVTWSEASETDTIFALQGRLLEYAGLVQPLTSQERSDFQTLPLMIEGFVVTARIPCANPTGQPLRLDPLSLSLIYSGAVTTWGHRVLTERNPWLTTCGAAIKVSVREGPAWSNVALKDYMSKRNPLFVPYKQRGRLAQWPSTLDVNCQGATEAHMVSCALISGSISYMRFQTAVANGLTPVELANQKDEYDPPADLVAGQWQQQWPKGCQDAALALTTVKLPNGGEANVPQPNTATIAGPQLDWSAYSLTYPGNGYALCAAGFIVTLTAPNNGVGQAGTQNFKDHLKVMWDTDPQNQLKDYGYAPLPETIRANMAGAAVVQG